jgi:hypothetical protein
MGKGGLQRDRGVKFWMILSFVQNTLFVRNKYRIHPIYALDVPPYHELQVE